MKFKIKPVPPFDLDLSAHIFSDGNAQIRRYENGKFWQVIRLGERPALVTAHSLGSVDAPELSIRLEPDGFSNDEAEIAKEIVCRLGSSPFSVGSEVSLYSNSY